MTVVTLGTNILALNAQNQVSKADSAKRSALDHLSSGLRINGASDDAAGLSIAASLNADVRVFKQGSRNISDGASYLSIADGATGELKNILVRMRELATQASNGTLSNSQRANLNLEAQALQLEYNRIVRVTNFNDVNVFTSDTLTVQAGYGTSGQVVGTIKASATLDYGDGTFQASKSYLIGAGAGVGKVTVGDLNSDGYVDLVTADSTADKLSVMLGNGNGTFTARKSYGAGDNARSVKIGDFNGDGIADLVSVSSNDNVVSVLIGNGNGTFQARSSFSTGAGLFDVVASDLNGDGKLDVITADSTVDQYSVALGNGNGTFNARKSIVAGDNPFMIILADFNRDGLNDLASADNNGSLSLSLGNGNGTFLARTSIDGGSAPWEIASGDFNGDGLADLVCSPGSGTALYVSLGNGNGTFNAKISVPLPNNSVRIAATDLNGDGYSDIVAGSTFADAVFVVLSNGNGTFLAGRTCPVGTSPVSVVLNDLNSDGILDIAVADASENTVRVLLGNAGTGLRGVRELSGISLATQDSALTAQSSLDTYLNHLNAITGVIGATQSRLQTALNNITQSYTEFKTAESRIVDADVAEESAKLIRANILEQGANAILSQANIQPKLALILLGN